MVKREKEKVRNDTAKTQNKNKYSMGNCFGKKKESVIELGPNGLPIGTIDFV